MQVLVTGATGFLGRRVVKALQDEGHMVRCLVHTPGRETVFHDPQEDVHYGDVTDLPSLRSAFYNLDAVVHLVAIIRENGTRTFESINHQGTRNVVDTARHSGVQHFVHMSAIGAQNTPASRYLYSKWLGEQAVISSGLPYTILRPSILFGQGDEFINTLAGMVRAFPVVPVVGSGETLFQPLAADDVARCVALSLCIENHIGKTLEIGGPQQLSYNEIVQILARTIGVRRTILKMPLPVVSGLVKVMETVLPHPPATTEQLRMVSIPNVSTLEAMPHYFGFQPRPIEGNIDFVRNISRWDGVRIAAGFTPTRIRAA